MPAAVGLRVDWDAERVRAAAREAKDAALAPARDSITPADARGWFNHCGYPLLN
jgi:hypothetical protein